MRKQGNGQFCLLIIYALARVFITGLQTESETLKQKKLRDRARRVLFFKYFNRAFKNAVCVSYGHTVIGNRKAVFYSRKQAVF